jgi:phosphate butyryltransferase
MGALGVERPKVAVLAAVEKLNPKMPPTVDAAELQKRCRDGLIKDCIVEVQISFDIAMSAEAARVKGMESQVAGDADIIIYPNIDVGNIAGKALVYSGGAKSAAIMVGARVPVINTSRSLSVDGKCRAIALAAACGVL